ncbi:hypothetical protein [Lonsdalea quercina]|uniref:hypothetical protein n=1 Tax=Lonsdalea quercina TaxID=71657 RepID=UPI003975C45B
MLQCLCGCSGEGGLVRHMHHAVFQDEQRLKGVMRAYSRFNFVTGWKRDGAGFESKDSWTGKIGWLRRKKRHDVCHIKEESSVLALLVADILKFNHSSW